MSDDALEAIGFLIQITGVAFAAFCVWLTVRIVNRREKWTKRTAIVLIVVFVGYPLSCGPLTWLLYRGLLPESAQVYFVPVLVLTDCSETAKNISNWYAKLWSP